MFDASSPPDPWSWAPRVLPAPAVAWRQPPGSQRRHTPWYIFYEPVHSHPAIVGLMAEQTLHGHFSAFSWGEAYDGAEPYVVALFFAVFGQSVWVLEAVPIVLAATAAVLTWRIARRLVDDAALGVLAGAAVRVVPQASVSNSTVELASGASPWSADWACPLWRCASGGRRATLRVGLHGLAFWPASAGGLLQRSSTTCSRQPGSCCRASDAAPKSSACVDGAVASSRR